MTVTSPALSVRSSRPRLPGRLRRPSPTATSAPTSERTIEWQKASARTVTATMPRVVPILTRCAEHSSTSRMVVAPSRRLQNTPKSCRPTREEAAASRRSTSRERSLTTWLRASGSSGTSASR